MGPARAGTPSGRRAPAICRSQSPPLGFRNGQQAAQHGAGSARHESLPVGAESIAMETGAVTAAMDRANGRIFLFSYLLVYFAAPVTYIGVVQAVLCDKLGTGAMVANLPFGAYQA